MYILITMGWCQYYHDNRERINAEYDIAKQTGTVTKHLYTCVCGSRFLLCTFRKHLCSQKHINFTARAAQNEKIDQKTDN